MFERDELARRKPMNNHVRLFALAATVSVASSVNAAAQTFNQDVAPIIYDKCVMCHREGEVAPMSLTTYDEIRPWARAIKARVVSREMPPWFADKASSHSFRSDMSLTDAQINTIAKWVDAGAPQGTGQAPAPPTFVEGWHTLRGRAPDMIIEMAQSFEIPAEGELPNFNVWSDNPFKDGRSRYMEGIELRPEVLPATHHSSVSTRPLPPGTRLGRGPAWQGGPDADFMPLREDGSVWGTTGDVNEETAADAAVVEARREQARNEAFATQGAGNLLLFYVPGGGYYEFPQGAVKAIHPTDVLTWGLHYTPTGKPERDRHRLGLWFAQSPPRHEVLTRRVGETHIAESVEVGPRFLPNSEAPDGGRVSGIPNIPPNANDWKITAITAFGDDVTLYGMWPHMHLRGKDMMFLVTYPDGREDVVLNVPKYDFNWQLQYQLEEPLRLPAGTTIKTIGHFDNSIANRYNPAPDKEVFWSEQSWDEMFNGWMEISIDKNVIPAQQNSQQQD